MFEAAEGDNHHNAALCPHCNPVLEELLRKERLKSLVRARDAAKEAATKTAPGASTRWTMGIYGAIDRLIQEEGG